MYQVCRGHCKISQPDKSSVYEEDFDIKSRLTYPKEFFSNIETLVWSNIKWAYTFLKHFFFFIKSDLISQSSFIIRTSMIVDKYWNTGICCQKVYVTNFWSCLIFCCIFSCCLINFFNILFEILLILFLYISFDCWLIINK